MRREHEFRMPLAEALELLASAPYVHLASTSADGSPVLKAVSAVMVDGAPCFHGSTKGEKTEALGRRAVVSAEEVIAELPSHFTDPDRACAASVLYRSAQVHGVLEAVESPQERAAILQRLMEKLQPEGGHLPITSEDPVYLREMKGVLIFRLRPERIDGKSKLAQNRTAEERLQICERLWARGLPGDARAIEILLEANPDTPRPAFLSAPAGVRLCCALKASDLPQAEALVASQYWNSGVSPEQLCRALSGSSAWVGARAPDGKLVAHARALSDGGKNAWIYDVATAEPWQHKGIALALMKMLLDHPSVRGAGTVWLHTRDAQPLYRKLGFRLRSELPPKPYAADEMGLIRSPASPPRR